MAPGVQQHKRVYVTENRIYLNNVKIRIIIDNLKVLWYTNERNNTIIDNINNNK